MVKHSEEEIAEIERSTQEIEQEKLNRKAEREARKLEKARKQKNLFLEKMVAPLLLIITVVISLVLLSGR